MHIALKGEQFAINMVTIEDDETRIEEWIAETMPLTSEMQAAIDAKYGTLAERQARKAAGVKPLTLETLAERVAALEAQVQQLQQMVGGST
jgi:hypothetical protein